jgi:hypothetical protein
MKEVNDQVPVPAQEKGVKFDTEYAVTVPARHEAQRLFSDATYRLLDVNRWDKLCGELSAVFRLMDSEGNAVDRLAQPGDHFRINIPAPGTVTGEGYDWVRIEALVDNRDQHATAESVTLRVRPATNPVNKDQADTAHFFKDDATSSFTVQREGNRVIAGVHSRNEVPNTEAEKVVDKVRNAIVALGAMAGLSSPQWKRLVKGLLEPPEGF